jgi:hypothetical protein
LWEGRCGAEAIGGYLPHELRVVTVVCNKRLLPTKIYLLRLPLNDGLFTKASYFTLRMFMRSECMTLTEMTDHHTDGWPPTLVQQLAVALDVPRAALNVPIEVGGPLLLAAGMRVSPTKAANYLR